MGQTGRISRLQAYEYLVSCTMIEAELIHKYMNICMKDDPLNPEIQSLNELYTDFEEYRKEEENYSWFNEETTE